MGDPDVGDELSLLVLRKDVIDGHLAVTKQKTQEAVVKNVSQRKRASKTTTRHAAIHNTTRPERFPSQPSHPESGSGEDRDDRRSALALKVRACCGVGGGDDAAHPGTHRRPQAHLLQEKKCIGES
jgi:hypothetical protein